MEDEATGATVIQVDGRGTKQTLSRPGPVLRLGADHIALAEADIRAADVLLCQLELRIEVVEGALRIAHDAGKRTVLDAAPARQVPDSVLAGIGLLCANSAEAEALTGITIDGRESASKVAQVLLERGCEAVAIAVGSDKLVAAAARRWWLSALDRGQGYNRRGGRLRRGRGRLSGRRKHDRKGWQLRECGIGSGHPGPGCPIGFAGSSGRGAHLGAHRTRSGLIGYGLQGRRVTATARVLVIPSPPVERFGARLAAFFRGF